MTETNMIHTEHCSFHPNYIWWKVGCVKLQTVLFPYTPVISCFYCHYLYNLLYHHLLPPSPHPPPPQQWWQQHDDDDDDRIIITATIMITTTTFISFLCSFHTELIAFGNKECSSFRPFCFERHQTKLQHLL